MTGNRMMNPVQHWALYLSQILPFARIGFLLICEIEPGLILPNDFSLSLTVLAGTKSLASIASPNAKLITRLFGSIISLRLEFQFYFIPLKDNSRKKPSMYLAI